MPCLIKSSGLQSTQLRSVAQQQLLALALAGRGQAEERGAPCAATFGPIAFPKPCFDWFGSPLVEREGLVDFGILMLRTSPPDVAVPLFLFALRCI